MSKSMNESNFDEVFDFVVVGSGGGSMCAALVVRSVGKSVTFKGESIRVEKVGPEAFKGVDVAFFSAGAAQSREYAPHAVKAGAVVVDKSSAFHIAAVPPTYWV